ncbi:MFS transporter [Planctomycetes bacterium CA13]|uniref:MFS transporter n=1 Tax=Novipirellula herctigrandis TaxID=2527986 RepID=UPI0011B591DF
MNTEKPALSFWQICNMSFGFFGIQFGWGLQMGNMSAIYEYLGASESELPLLWLAAPLTGLIVQPIVGYMSDNTWCWLGRRRPYFLFGAIFSSIALILMPRSGALWMAAGLLWVLDASVNISMEPFRAFVADLLPERQRTVGFAMQSVFIGAGAVIASKLPGWLKDCGVDSTTSDAHPIPQTVHVAFTAGAFVFFFAVLWTVISTREKPPSEAELAETKQKRSGMAEIYDAFRHMPSRMKHLAVVQFLTWMGLFCMWIFFTVAVARDILGATDAQSDLYKTGIYLANDCFATYNLVAFFTAIGFLWIGRFVSAKWIHVVSMFCGGLGLASLLFVRDPTILTWGCFTGVGIAWASILSMPYAMLAGSLPERRIGVYMGIFNLFIVIPQILVAIVLSRVLAQYDEVNRLHVVVFGGVCLLLAAIVTAFLPYSPEHE